MDIIRFFAGNPEYETDRLLLRKLLPKDACDMFAYARLPETSKYLLWEPHPSETYTLDLIRYLQKEYTTGRYSDFAIILKENSKMIGTVGFTSYDDKNKVAEVGYVISPEYWHRGIATEALSAILGIAFNELKAERVEAKYMPENIYSRCVMEKCHMQYEGTARKKMLVKGKHRDIAYCAILKDEFLTGFSEKNYISVGKLSRLRHYFDFYNKN